MRPAVLVVAVLFGLGTWAQALEPRLASTGPVHGRFVQEKTVSGLSRSLASRGSFSLWPGRGLVWRTESPLPGTVVLTLKGVYALDSKGARRLRAGAEPLALMNEILDGTVDALNKSFVIQSVASGGGWRLNLVPKPGPLAALFKSIDVEGSAFATKATLVETSRDTTVIRFEDVKKGPGLMRSAEESLLGP